MKSGTRRTEVDAVLEVEYMALFSLGQGHEVELGNRFPMPVEVEKDRWVIKMVKE